MNANDRSRSNWNEELKRLVIAVHFRRPIKFPRRSHMQGVMYFVTELVDGRSLRGLTPAASESELNVER